MWGASDDVGFALISSSDSCVRSTTTGLDCCLHWTLKTSIPLSSSVSVSLPLLDNQSSWRSGADGTSDLSFLGTPDGPEINFFEALEKLFY